MKECFQSRFYMWVCKIHTLVAFSISYSLFRISYLENMKQYHFSKDDSNFKLLLFSSNMFFEKDTKHRMSSKINGFTFYILTMLACVQFLTVNKCNYFYKNKTDSSCIFLLFVTYDAILIIYIDRQM